MHLYRGILKFKLLLQQFCFLVEHTAK